MKKYEFTNETKEVRISHLETVTLHRIRAVIPLPICGVEEGEEGGWIETEENLSHDGNAWVYNDAMVFGDAMVFDDASVYQNAKVFGNASVHDWGKVHGNAKVFDDAEICGYASVFGNAIIGGNAKVYGDAEVFGNAEVCGDAEIFRRGHIVVVSGENFVATFFRCERRVITVSCNDFMGEIDDFLTQDAQDGSKSALVYRAAAELARLQIDLTEETPEEDD